MGVIGLCTSPSKCGDGTILPILSESCAIFSLHFLHVERLLFAYSMVKVPDMAMAADR
jgi:hypothetical protein